MLDNWSGQSLANHLSPVKESTMSQEPGEIPLKDAIRFVQRARQAKLLTVNGWSYPTSLIRDVPWSER